LNLRGRDVARKNSTDSAALGVYFEHDTRRVFSIQPKESLQNDDYEIHRGEIIVQQQNLVQGRRRELCTFRFEQGTVLMLCGHA